jgi:hypothetical protein
MVGFGYLTAILVAAIAFACSAYMYFIMGEKEGVTQQELAPLLVTAVTSLAGFVVAVGNAVAYFAYYRDDLMAWRAERDRQAGPQLHALLGRIRRERRKFDKLRDEKPPQGGFNEYTEIAPFENLERALKPVSDLWGYRRLARKILDEIARVQAMPRGGKNVAAFMQLLEKLEAKLEADVTGRPKTA